MIYKGHCILRHIIQHKSYRTRQKSTEEKMARFFAVLNVGILVLVWSTFGTDGLHVVDDQQLREMREGYVSGKLSKTLKFIG